MIVACESRKTIIHEYEFELTFKLPQGEAPVQYFVELEISCADALIGTGQAGYMAFNFSRESSVAYDAIVSAVEDIKKVIPKALLVEAMPDFVGLTDVAELLGFSRQYMRKLMVKRGTAFPSPVMKVNLLYGIFQIFLFGYKKIIRMKSKIH